MLGPPAILANNQASDRQFVERSHPGQRTTSKPADEKVVDFQRNPTSALVKSNEDVKDLIVGAVRLPSIVSDEAVGGVGDEVDHRVERV